MKVSVVIASLWNHPNSKNLLEECINSLIGADEILTLVTTPTSPLGFAEAFNKIASLATGDFIIPIGHANKQTSGNLKELCIEDCVTYPNLNNSSTGNPYIFCLPRNIYNKYGLYDMRYNDGNHWEETDFWKTMTTNNINIANISSVNFNKDFGGSSMTQIPDIQKRVEHNREIYRLKWGDNGWHNF